MKKIKKILFFTMILTALMLCCLFSFTASAEAGNTFGSAQSIEVNTGYTDNISSWDDVDYFKFTLSSPGKIVINFQRENLYDTSNFWTSMLYNQDLKLITQRYYSGNYTSSNSCGIGLPAGTYYIKVTNDAELSRKDYTLTVNYTKSNYWEKEFNNSFKNATAMTLNKKYSGVIDKWNDADYYKITLASDGVISFKFERENLYDSSYFWALTLYNENSAVIAQRLYTGNYTESKSSEFGLAAGTYFIKIEEDNEHSNKTYNLTTSYKKSNVWEKEMNNSTTKANPIALNKEYNGSIMNSSDEDYYKFTLTEKTKIDFKFIETASEDYDYRYYVKIYNSNVVNMGGFDIYSDQSSKNASFELNEGTYFIHVDSDFNYSTKPYTLCVTTGVTSKITSTKTTSSVTLKWNKISGVAGYRIYQKVSGKWENIADTSKLTYTIKNLKAGTKYSFAVKGYTLDGKTKVMAPKYKTINVTTAEVLGVTSKLTATQTTSSVTLKWNKVTGATGYRVYRMKKGEWKKLADTTKLTYTDKKLSSGSTYKYAVKAYTTKNGKTVWATKYKEIETSTKPAASTLKVTSPSKGKATLTWSNPSGESGFEIYYSTKKDSGFKKIATTKANATKATVSKLTSKKTYYFKVRSFKTTKSGKAYSAYSSVKSIKVK